MFEVDKWLIIKIDLIVISRACQSKRWQIIDHYYFDLIETIASEEENKLIWIDASSGLM